MSPKRVLIKDAHLPWTGAYPYEHLARRLRSGGFAPIGPESTADEIKNCLFDLMQLGAPEESDRLAWDELRHADRRLLADFFLYDVAEPDSAAVSATLGEVEIPIYFP